MIGLCISLPASCSSCTFCGVAPATYWWKNMPLVPASDWKCCPKAASGALAALAGRGSDLHRPRRHESRCAPPVEAIAEPAMTERRPAIVPLSSLTCHQLSRFHRAVLAFARARRGQDACGLGRHSNGIGPAPMHLKSNTGNTALPLKPSRRFRSSIDKRAA
jgi:hypothetical protein